MCWVSQALCWAQLWEYWGKFQVLWQALAWLFPQIAYFGDCSEATALSFLAARQDYPEQIQRSLYFTNSSSFCRSQYASIFSNVEFRDRKVELREWKLVANYRNYCRALYNLLGSKKLLINHSSNSIVELKRMGDNSLYNLWSWQYMRLAGSWQAPDTAYDVTGAGWASPSCFFQPSEASGA